MRLVSLVLLSVVRSATGNWLLQCSSCVDQSYFADEKIKSDVTPYDTGSLLTQIKQLQVQQFTHTTEEHYNKFFNRTQLGILAQDLAEVMPEAVAMVPERRYVNGMGASQVTKDVLMIRDSHLMFSMLGAVNHLGHDFDTQETIVNEHGRSLGFVKEEQELNKKKREDIMEQLLRTIATTEVLARALQTTEVRFSGLETEFALLQNDNKLSREEVLKRMGDAEDAIAAMKRVLEKEAHVDLVEKRKRAETDLEKAKVLKEIEHLRYTEEQKTIRLKEKEKKESEAAIMKMHKDKIKFEQNQKLSTDLTTIKAQEESNLRQHAEKAKHELAVKQLEVEQKKFEAERKLQEAVERAKIEQDAKIKEIRENEDIHTREQKLKLEGQKQQVIVAIQATAKIVLTWVLALYSSNQNLIYAIGSFLAIVAGIYFTREMATLLREQLNKRLGRPSLVRFTSKKTRVGELMLCMRHMLCCCLCRERAGHEFDDVVLHKKLEDQIFRLANATKNAKARRMPLLHIMFYGPPGTGKTMCAQRFAEYSGLEYAFMSGADVAPLEEQAVTELHKLFTWVHKSRKGVLLFIDEADAFLAQRNKAMSESLRNALTTMLYHTGTPTSQFLMVLATNRPGDLDPAVLDRIDESVEFGLPDLAERERMVFQYFDLYVKKPLKIHLKLESKKHIGSEDKANSSGRKKLLSVDTSPDAVMNVNEDVDATTLRTVARHLRTFSGREIAKLFTGLQTHICAHIRGVVRTRNLRLTKGTIMEVVRNKVEEHNRTVDVLAKGYAYVHREQNSPSLPSTPATQTLMYGGPKLSPLSARVNGQAEGFNPNINISISNNNSLQQADVKNSLQQVDSEGKSSAAGDPLKGDGEATAFRSHALIDGTSKEDEVGSKSQGAPKSSTNGAPKSMGAPKSSTNGSNTGAPAKTKPPLTSPIVDPPKPSTASNPAPAPPPSVADIESSEHATSTVNRQSAANKKGSAGAKGFSSNVSVEEVKHPFPAGKGSNGTSNLYASEKERVGAPPPNRGAGSGSDSSTSNGFQRKKT